MAGLDWCMPQTTDPAPTPPDIATGPVVVPKDEARHRRPCVLPCEINPARRRRDTDLIVEPGSDARGMARMLDQPIEDFIAIAITERITRLRDKLRA